MRKENAILYKNFFHYKKYQLHIEKFKLMIDDINKIQTKIEKKNLHASNEKIKLELEALSKMQQNIKDKIEYKSKISFSKYQDFKQLKTIIKHCEHELQNIRNIHYKNIKKQFDKIHSISPIQDIMCEITKLHHSDLVDSFEQEYMFVKDDIHT